MINKRFPNYPDDNDYTTNAPSYYDDLARKQKLVRLLSEKIWEYENTLNETLDQIEQRLTDYILENDGLMTERLENWDLRIEEMPEEMRSLFVTWLNDGTLEQIINHDVLGNKADKEYVDEQLTKLTSVINLGESKWGLKMDGVTDDSDALESVLQKANEEGYTVLFPKGTIKITRPLYINYHEKDGIELSKPPTSLSIFGLGGVSSGILTDYGSKIVAYNIPDTKSALNFIGKNNGLTTSVQIENIQIKLDYETCSELSFSLMIGDSWQYTLRRIKTTGFNGLLIRAGSAPLPNSETYAHIGSKIDQCIFLTNRYVKWDGTSTDTKNKWGFAIASERLFEDETGTPYRADTIEVSSSVLGGSVFNYFVEAQYNNCMWYIPGGYKSPNEITLDTRFSNFIKEYFTHFDCSTGLYQTGGNTTLINPYFEDVKAPIISRGVYGFTSNLLIFNPLFLGTFNTSVILSGIKMQPTQAIKSEGAISTHSNLYIRGGNYTKGNQGFENGFLVNNSFTSIELKNVTGVTDSDITDTVSTARAIEHINKGSNKKTHTFYNTGDTDFKDKNTDMDYFIVSDKSILRRIEIYTDTPLTGNHNIRIMKDGNILLQFQDIGLNSGNRAYISKQTVGTGELYTIDALPNKVISGYGSGIRELTHFEAGTVLQVKKLYNSLDKETNFTVFLYFDS